MARRAGVQEQLAPALGERRAVILGLRGVADPNEQHDSLDGADNQENDAETHAPAAHRSVTASRRS